MNKTFLCIFNIIQLAVLVLMLADSIQQQAIALFFIVNFLLFKTVEIMDYEKRIIKLEKTIQSNSKSSTNE